MASCSSAKASTGAYSWADVARGNVAVESSVFDRPFGKSRSTPLSSEVVARPWKEVAERIGSALAQETDDETDILAENAAEQPLSTHFTEPWGVGARGSRRVFCCGEVLVMMGHYGWLMASETIDHPAALKNKGHIYVHRRDIANGVTLLAGDRVCFYLYVDEQGLGAEDCRLQGWEMATRAVQSEQGLNPNAADFVPSMLRSPCTQMPSCSFVAPAFDSMAVNLAYWTDDSDSDSSDSSEASDSGIDGDTEGVRPAQRRTKAWSRGSTSCTGLSSDSESSGRRRRRKQPAMKVNPPTAPPPGLDPTKQTVAPPPGLSLQVGSIPLSPGLGFDSEAMIPPPPGLA